MAVKVVDGSRQDARPQARRLSAVGSIRKPAEKFGARRDELGRAALDTLSQLGYARTGLREIAHNSGYSLGVLHYYFSDKNELIIHCVKQYKAECVLRYDAIVDQSTTARRAVRTLRSRAWPRNRSRRRPRCTDSGTTCAPRRCSKMFSGPAMVEIDTSIEAMVWRVIDKVRAAGQARSRSSPRPSRMHCSTACSSGPCWAM